jgi:hypothetical protein
MQTVTRRIQDRSFLALTPEQAAAENSLPRTGDVSRIGGFGLRKGLAEAVPNTRADRVQLTYQEEPYAVVAERQQRFRAELEQHIDRRRGKGRRPLIAHEVALRAYADAAVVEERTRPRRRAKAG